MNQAKKAYLSGKTPNDADFELRIGSEFQADIPQLKSLKLCDLIQNDEDKHLWCSSILPEDEVVDYLHSIRLLGWKGLNEEKALILLHRSNYDKKEALRRFNLLPDGFRSTVWSQNECLLFEDGIQKFGKDFSSIQKMVQTKNINETVEFYYFWKKSERHDVFIKEKLGRVRSRFKTRQKKKMYRITDFTELFEQQLADLNNQVRTRSRSRLFHAN
ncbi:Mesoderm induction early response protein 1 [Araneus ventricosus]|uniref:Mesoderm induction early response protein 1 n=1 Tax=Araneus ventricosus TaxID=182803 RepID=A0A4Y2BVU4_ARAVE|nr:Mesoderm induction early response protein 1 [Araneus ventricosus]